MSQSFTGSQLEKDGLGLWRRLHILWCSEVGENEETQSFRRESDLFVLSPQHRKEQVIT